MTDFATDFKRSRKYLTDLKRIVGEHLIGEAPIQDDQEKNTDLIVLRLDAVRIACRIRRRSYFDSYPEEFTIRAGRPSGAKTELTKLVEGWGDYFLYGFANESDAALHAWTLCDLKVFRLWFNRSIVNNRGILPGIHKENIDGSSDFRAFALRDLPRDFIVAQHRPPVLAATLDEPPPDDDPFLLPGY